MLYGRKCQAIKKQINTISSKHDDIKMEECEHKERSNKFPQNGLITFKNNPKRLILFKLAKQKGLRRCQT